MIQGKVGVGFLLLKIKKSLKNYVVDLSTKDGVHSVVIPDEVLDSATPLWEDFLVGNFLDMAPHIAKVHVILNKIWNYGDSSSKVDVYEVNNTTMRFRVKNPKSRESILRRGMWNIAGVPMVVTKWTPKAEEEKQEENSIPMWVHLKKVPLHMFSWEGLSFITSAVGHPVRLHPDTEACSTFELAKVFVNVDVSKVLPKAINFLKNDKEFTAEFIYPWLPSRCKLCDKWGHTETVCVMGKTDEKKQSETIIQKILQREEGKEQVNRESTPNTTLVDTGNLKGEDTLEKGQVEVVDESWATPLKIGRSPSKSPVREQGVDPIISASKFSVLSIEEEEEEGEIQKDTSQVSEESDAITGEDLNMEGNVAHTGVQTVVPEVAQTEDTVTDSQQSQISLGKRKKRNKLLENSAVAPDGNSVAMSTRSSRRNL
ncbi:hypothetical protein N665_0013s0011 [Sinapis alba]|nr:hypothetical protein N665_0013s0011 [Sinapis alba]